MSDEKLPIKFFAPREIDELRVEGSGNSEPPKWLLSGEDLVKRAFELTNEFNAFERDVASKQDRGSIIPFVFVATLCDDATAKSRRHDVSRLFQTRERSNVIGMSYSDELMVSIDSLAEMKTISARLKDYDNNKYAISCLQHFEPYAPIVSMEKDKQNYKVKLLDFQNYEKNIAIQRLFERTISEKEIAFKKVNYTDTFIVYSLKDVDEVILDSLSNSDVYEALFSIEPMPKYTVSLDFSEDSQEIQVRFPNENQNYATIGILDNGIAKIPHLAPWIVGKRSTVYPDKSINPTHGTFVSGIAVYGDVCAGQEWVGNNGVKLFDATVFPDTDKEGIDEDELIANIKESISQNHDEVKIWNLSISITRPVDDRRFSDFAIALDSLQDKFNILVCKSAGNCNNFMSGRPKGRIHEGADSVRSLVVGSIAHEQNEHDFAEVNNPSPFSRIGPGPEYIIKPEVVHYGGNAGIDKKGLLHVTGVKSFSKDGSLSKAIGTSFSTPRITSLAAGIHQELNEEFDPLLIKALIVHSASYSKNLKIPNEERTKQIGFGRPKTVSDIIYNSPHEATLILRDKLVKGEFIDIMDFPMPSCLIKDGFYTGQVIATLAYDPILDPTQGAEYCQSNIDIKFGSYDEKAPRDVTKRNILNPIGRQGSKNLFHSSLYSKKRMNAKQDDFALKERLLIQYGDKYYPVKKYAVDLSEMTDNNKISYLSPDK